MALSGGHAPVLIIIFAIGLPVPRRKANPVPDLLTSSAFAGTNLFAPTHAVRGVALSRHGRSGSPQLLSEFVAAFGLLCVIWGCSRSRSSVTAFAVAAYITAAYWFTASTSFANPAVTIARSLSDTFAGIRPIDVPLFVVAQFAGGLAATFLFRWMVPALPSSTKDVVVAKEVVDVFFHVSK
jgi:glycerol uptake facilitator-like aquaporin